MRYSSALIAVALLSSALLCVAQADPARNDRVQAFEPCPGGREHDVCRSVDSAGLLFSDRYSTDPAQFPGPIGVPAFFDSTRVTLTQYAGDVFFISGRPDRLEPWVSDGYLYLETTDLGSGSGAVLDSGFLLCEPMDRVIQRVPALDITASVPSGTHCVTFRLADFNRTVIGNSPIYLVKGHSGDGFWPRQGQKVMPAREGIWLLRGLSGKTIVVADAAMCGPDFDAALGEGIVSSDGQVIVGNGEEMALEGVRSSVGN